MERLGFKLEPQAALQLGHWSDALQAADEALVLDEEEGVSSL